MLQKMGNAVVVPRFKDGTARDPEAEIGGLQMGLRQQQDAQPVGKRMNAHGHLRISKVYSIIITDFAENTRGKKSECGGWGWMWNEGREG